MAKTMVDPVAQVGMDVTNKILSLQQLQAELVTAGLSVNGLGTQGPDKDAPPGPTYLFTYDAQGLPSALPAGSQAVVDAHIGMRDKTSAEYATEFQDPNTTAARKQEIRDIQAGLLPAERVPMT
jgi:hypothetical protein